MEVYADYSNHSSDTVGHRAKKMGAARGRSEKNAIRVCGDWSEQLSSKGKIYFYNCITEVSQWQKPPEWKLPDMDQDELIKRLRSRDQSDGKNLKRQRIVTSTSTSNKESSLSDRCASPKRTKYCNDLRNRTQVVDRKPSPAVIVGSAVQRLNCVADVSSRSYPSRQRIFSRLSPEKYDRRGCQNINLSVQSRRSTSSNGPPRLLPTDDMEISPNSSPLSGGSSPSRPLVNNQSPHLSKCSRASTFSRITPQQSVRDHLKAQQQNEREGDTKSNKSNSGTLRQLVDAIRASIGGLLDHSPTARPVTDESPSSEANSKLYLQRKADSLCPSSRCTPTQASTGGSLTERHLRSKHFDDDSSSFQMPLGERRTLFHPSDRSIPSSTFPTATQDLPHTSVQNKDNSGLVSTLTTLVNFIGHTKYSNTPTGDNRIINTVPNTISSTRASTQRTPTHLPVSHHYNTISPVIPSPLTPVHIAATSGTSNHMRTHSMLLNSSCNLSSHQVDELLSTLETLTHTSDSRTTKPTIEYYQPSRLPGINNDNFNAVMTSTATVNRDMIPQKQLCQNPGLASRIHEDPEMKSGCSTYLNEARPPLCSPPEAGRYRHFSDSDRVNGDVLNHHRLGTSAYSRATEAVSYRSPCPNSSETIDPILKFGHGSQLPFDSADTSNTASTIAGSRDPPTSRSNDKQSSPSDEQSLEDELASNLNRLLSSSTTQAFVDSSMINKFMEKSVERLEQEANLEARKFDKLQSVLYGELSAESKKLRALVRISEAKLAIHREKQTALQDLMDAIETRKQLPNLSFSGDVL